MPEPRPFEWNDPVPVDPSRDVRSRREKSLQVEMPWIENKDAAYESVETVDPVEDSPPDPLLESDELVTPQDLETRIPFEWQSTPIVRPTRNPKNPPETVESPREPEVEEEESDGISVPSGIGPFPSDLAAVPGVWMRIREPEAPSPNRETDSEPMTWGPPAIVSVFTILMLLFLWTYAERKWSYLGYYGFDYGIFNQGLWLMSEGEAPFVTLRGLNLFGDHSSYIMVLLVPLKWLIQDPRLLLWISLVAVASCGPLGYWAARASGANQRKSLAASLIIAVHPSMIWTIPQGFHPETLAIPLAILAYIAAVKQRWWFWGGLMGLIALIKEDSLLLTVPFALFVWLRWKSGRKAALTVAATTTVLSLVNILLVIPRLQNADTGYQYATRIELNGLIDPGHWVFVLGVLGLALALGKRAWPALLIGLPSLLVHMASGHPPETSLAHQYTAFGLAAAAVAIVSTAGFVHRHYIWGVVAAAFAFSFLGGPWSPRLDYYPWGGTIFHSEETDDILNSIPPEAGLSVNFSLGAVLSQRSVIYEYPAPWERVNWGVPSSPDPDPSLVDFVVTVDYDEIRQELDADPAWRLVTEGGELAVFAPVSSTEE